MIRWQYGIILAFVVSMLVVSGCSTQVAKPAQQPVDVKVMQVIKKDTSITYEFVGAVEAQHEVPIQARVSGNIIEKMVTGGAVVVKGQPLFRIDNRQYGSAVRTAQAQLAQAEAVLSNSRVNTQRYQQLASQDAVAQQTLDTQVSTEEQNLASVNAYRGNLQAAQDNLEDTLIVSPIDGRIDIKDLSIGSYVGSGSTTLATVTSVDPVEVKFSMSENEYLKFVGLKGTSDVMSWGRDLKLILSDGSTYPLLGQIETVDKGLATGTGTLTLKASFDNPSKLLVPGMFARIVMQGEVRRGAFLIPQRAVQQLLDKTVVTVVTPEDKTETRVVKMGGKVGDMWIVEDGLTDTDRVIVEGFLKTRPGTPVSVIMIGPDDLKTPASK